MPHLSAARTNCDQQTLLIDGDFVARLASPPDAERLVAMYQAALGEGGVGAPGCQAYPDPSLFDARAMADNLQEGRIIVIVESKVDGTILGGMALDVLGPYQIENNCMAVRRDMRGRSIGTMLMRAASQYCDQRDLLINCTELVTHSLASQAAHVADGFTAFCGFGYSHYPRVFFADRPESVLWTWRAYGKALAQQPSGDGAAPADAEVMRLVESINAARSVFVPDRYATVCRRIADQFKPLLRYNFEEVEQEVPLAPTAAGAGARVEAAKIVVQRNDGYEHGYVICPPRLELSDIAAVEEAVKGLFLLDKRFIAVRMSANSPVCPLLAERLREMGFAFHSFLPLYGWDEETRSFFDVFTMQFVAPKVQRANPLPGETESVIKIYGYPSNITGAIIGTVARDLREHAQLMGARERTRGYHEQYYGQYQLYAPGSWLAQADPMLATLAKALTDHSKVLDLGCGVGRNSLELAKATGAHVTCVDILPSAIEQLVAYAAQHGVADRVQATAVEMEHFVIQPAEYDLIMAVSAIEHVASRVALRRVLGAIEAGVRAGGKVLITTSTARNITCAASGLPVQTQVETPLSEGEAVEILQQTFSGWHVSLLETSPYRENISLDGRNVIWQSVEVKFIAEKPQGSRPL